MQYLHVPPVVARHLEPCEPEYADAEVYVRDAQGRSVRVPVRFRSRTSPLVDPG